MQELSHVLLDAAAVAREREGEVLAEGQDPRTAIALTRAAVRYLETLLRVDRTWPRADELLVRASAALEREEAALDGRWVFEQRGGKREEGETERDTEREREES